VMTTGMSPPPTPAVTRRPRMPAMAVPTYSAGRLAAAAAPPTKACMRKRVSAARAALMTRLYGSCERTHRGRRTFWRVSAK